jgi:hypothetical protein
MTFLVRPSVLLFGAALAAGCNTTSLTPTAPSTIGAAEVGSEALAQSGNNIFTEEFNPVAPFPQPLCEGFRREGATYAFTIDGAPSTDCRAQTLAGGGITQFVHFPLLAGTTAGILHIDFDHPTNVFGFGVARTAAGSSGVVTDHRVVVELFRPGSQGLRQELTLQPSVPPFPGPSGGRFDYRGPAVQSVDISFPGLPASRFAIDNVTYVRPSGQVKK